MVNPWAFEVEHEPSASASRFLTLILEAHPIHVPHNVCTGMNAA